MSPTETEARLQAMLDTKQPHFTREPGAKVYLLLAFDETLAAIKQAVTYLKGFEDLALKDERDYRLLQQKYDDLERQAGEMQHRIMELEALQAQEPGMLLDLLARIHGDGGHYVQKHGIEKAAEDADKMVAEWRAQICTAQNEREACAKLCDDYAAKYRARGTEISVGRGDGAEDCALMIRARGDEVTAT